MTEDLYKFFFNHSLRLLARKAYAEKELQRAMERYAKRKKIQGFSEPLKKVINRLCELNYLDDEKILANYLEYHLPARPVGKFFFLQAMMRRGIAFEKAAKAWESRDISEKELAQALLERSRQKFEKLSYIARKKKMVSLLGGRGFSPDIVWDVVK